MPNTQLVITGQAIFEQNTLPAKHARIELWDDAGDYGLLATTYTSDDGKFAFYINSPISDLIDDTTITLDCKTYFGNILVPSKTTLQPGTISITIDHKEYDTEIKYPVQVQSASFITVSGRVSDSAGNPAVEVTVNIYEKGFRSEVLISQTQTDINGFYSAKISTKDIANSVVIQDRTIETKAYDDTTLIAASGDFLWSGNIDLEINLVTHAEEYTAPSQFQNLVDKISHVLNGVATFNDFAAGVEFTQPVVLDPGDNPINPANATPEYGDANGELSYIARATGCILQDIQLIIKSYQVAAGMSIPHQIMYAIMRGKELEENPVLTIYESFLRISVEAAIATNIIDNLSQQDIDDAMEAIRAFQANAAKDIRLVQETYTLGDVLKNIFGGVDAEADTLDFLDKYNYNYETADEFWDYYSTVEPTKAEKAQRGLRLASIAGFQPEMTGTLTADTEGGIFILASWSIEEWVDYISAVSLAAGNLCVPQAIIGDLTDEEEIKELYARKLTSIIHDQFPLTALNVLLEDSQQGPDIIPDEEIREQVISFIADNPNFDLRINNVYDINEENPDVDLTNVEDVEDVQQAMAPMQRMLRLIGGNPAAVAQFMTDTLDSYAAIAQVPPDTFVTAYATMLGSPDAAYAAHAKAIAYSTAASVTFSGMYQASAQTQIGVFQWPHSSTPPVQHVDPNIKNLFGSTSYCACEQCLSVYSPAAYFTDIMNFLRVGIPGSPLPNVYGELIRRRPDLEHIDLTCKNTNTVMPYIDLAIELLEGILLKRFTQPSVDVPPSYQTSGTAKELAAHPEHVYKVFSTVGGIYTWQYLDFPDYVKAYDPMLYSDHNKNLTNVVYPFNLPFSLPAEETRTYLTHLGYSRYNAMKMFKPYSPFAIGITDFDIYAEMLGITSEEAKIIADIHTLSADTWKFYGLDSASVTNFVDPADPTGPLLSDDWDDLLTERLDVLIQQLKMPYRQFLQFLTSDFLNKPVSGDREITVASKDITRPDTCDLTKLKLVFTGSATPAVFLNKLHRFVRLWNTGKMNVSEWDKLFTSLLITTLDDTDFELIARVLQFSNSLGMKPTELTGWWWYMDIHQYVDYTSELQNKQPSVYDLLHRNRAVLNLPLPEFGDLGADDPTSIPPTSLPAQYEGFTAPIAAANNIAETDLLLILAYIGITNLATDPVTLGDLSRIYFFATLCRKTGYTVANMLKLLYMLDITIDAPVTTQSDIPIRLDNLSKILSAIDAIGNSSLTLEEMGYLVESIGDSGPISPAPINIQIFFEKMRSELQKFPVYAGALPPVTPDEITAYNRVANIVYQSISKETNLPSEWASIIIDSSEVAYFISSAFVNSTDPITPDDPILGTLYPAYRRMYKMAYITQKFRLNTVEFQYLFNTPLTVGFDFTLLPTSSAATQPTLGDLFNGLLQLSCWINVRDRLSLIEDQLVRLLKAAADEASDVNASMAVWQSIINREKWGTMLKELIGDPATIVASTPTGLLNSSFPDDFTPSAPSSISKLWGMIGIMSACLRTGLTPATMLATLQQAITMAESHQVILAAKGKHTEDEWGIIAKPLRDTLRKKQRDALAGFVVSHPDPTNVSNVQIWRNENDLYAFLLIDIEMEACMKTSRIKQAICSVQLYIDRVLLGLEYRNGNATDRINLPANMQYQWEQWRAWYRIWEANRKVFLYPENWIEPELRDDKSVFFTQMEETLFQGEVTDQRAEEALFGYLRKVQDVAQLEPMAVCDTRDPSTLKVITHVLARTYTEPHKYYYRRLLNNVWTAWEPLEIEVKGNHVSMIVWKNQLYLFWLTMREKQVLGRPSNVSYVLANHGLNNTKWFYKDTLRTNNDSNVNEPNPVYVKQIEITVNWSEYKEGQWRDAQVGKQKMNLDLNPVILKNYINMFDGGALFGMSGDTINSAFGIKELYERLSENKSLSIAEFIMSRLSLHTFREDHDSAVFLMIHMPYKFFENLEYGQNIHAFVFTKHLGVEVWENWFGGSFPAPGRLAYKDNKFINWYRNTPDHPDNGKLFVHNTETIPMSAYCYPGEYITTLNLPKRTFVYPVLNKAPYKNFSVVCYSHVTANRFNVMQKGFFYNDNKYGYFARPVNISGGTTSLAAAAEAAAGYYYSGTPLNTVYGSSIVVTSVGATQKFYFQSFFHGRVNDFLKTLNSGGIDGLMNIQTQDQTNTLDFNTLYEPTSLVYSARVPVNKVDFEYDAAYSVYNWELFFHMPLLVAKRLSDNQQFEEARKWYHYIFDPTCNIDASGSISHSRQRFWRFRPFYDAAGAAISSVDDLLMQIHLGNSAALDQLQVWMDNPFKPHVIARMRVLSYMKNVVMCYMDNLIAWADQLYRQDTIETINQATNLYIVVANILGDRPQEVPKRLSTGPRTFDELADAGLDAFSNAMVGVENYIDPNSGPLVAPGGAGGPIIGDTPPIIKLFYFCLPNNPKLLAYWDVIANRLFNIRNCRNIDGQLRELPLYDAPIDPAILVRAAAAGIDASSVLDDLSTPPMPYRFTVMLQKANELCNDVKALGGALLSALEKKDAEELALIRSGHEIAVLESMRAAKQAMIDEAAANIEALRKSKDVAQVRLTYYSTRPYKIPNEIKHLQLLDDAQKHQNRSSILSAIGAVVSVIPELSLQIPFAIGPSFGGRELSALFSALSTIQAMKASQKNTEANKAITEAGYERRRDDWQFQAESAQKEIVQIERQIIASEIRKSITEKELVTHDLQTTNAKAVDEYMREKYTGLELYNWMVAQISATYFQAYQFAYDVSKRAEKCLNFELPWINTPGGSFVRFGYWDSLKKGLMSGEKMQYDLRKMEIAYLEANTRELELTKHFSLAMENPAQLLELRETGSCFLVCTQDMFDLDYPGHYMRRVKSVSISIPCVAGPYTTIAATLTQSACEIEDASGTIPPSPTYTSPSMVAMSGAQNDSGVFELSLRDERYLPFEGSGALCTWNLSLMDDETLRQFDYNTISDVIIHVKYTAQYSDTKRGFRTTALHNAFNNLDGVDLPRYFSLRHEFANAWYAYAVAFASDDTAQMEIAIDSRMFPYLCHNKEISVKQWDVMVKPKSALADTYKLEAIYEESASDHTMDIDPLNTSTNYSGTGTLTPAAVIEPAGNKVFKLRLINTSAVPDPINVDINELLNDIYLVATYTLDTP